MPNKSTIRRRLFARYYDRAIARYEHLLEPQKRELFSSLEGTVVEIGPGTGVNLALLPEGVRWIGIEPNEHMHPLLKEKAAALGFEVDLRDMHAEQLPLEDSSVDAVISTLVMCSLPDVSAALREVRRVLKPGAGLYFWEHVIAPEGVILRSFQNLVSPIHRFWADGCNTNRDLGTEIRAAGFSKVELQEFQAPRRAAPPWVRPHVCGIATR